MTIPPGKRIQQARTNELYVQGIPRETCRDNGESPREYTGRTGSAPQPLPNERRRGYSIPSASFEPPFGMEITGTAAVAAPLPAPGQHQPGTAGMRPDQASQHMAHFRYRQ